MGQKNKGQSRNQINKSGHHREKSKGGLGKSMQLINHYETNKQKKPKKQKTKTN